MSPIEFSVLEYKVTDPNAWYDNVLKTFGQARADAMLAAKVERWYQEYVQASSKPDYKTRAQRDAAAQAATEAK